MPENDADSVEISVHVEAPRDIVFSFLTDSEKLVRWLADSVHATAQPGGTLRIEASGGEVISGEFVEIVPMEKVVFTWGWQSAFPKIPPGSTTVEITLEPDGDGTVMHLRHFGLPTDTTDKHKQGWIKAFERLSGCFSD